MTESQKSPLAKRVWNIFKIALAIALAGFVLSKTNFAEVAGLMGRLSPLWLAFSFILFCALTLIKAFQYYVLTGRRASYARVLYVVVMQNAVSNFIASGAGIASYLTMLSVDEGVRFRRALSSFVIAKIGDLISVWLVLLATAILLWPRIAAARGLILALLLAILAGVGIFLAAAFLRQRFMDATHKTLRFFRLDGVPLIRRGMDVLASFAEQDSQTVRTALFNGLLYSLIYMAVTLLWFYANIRAYSLNFSFIVVSFVNAFMQLISWIPIQVFGGLGVSEVSLVYLFGMFGLPAAQVAAMGIGLRALLYGFTLIALLYLPLSALLDRSSRSLDIPSRKK